MRVGIVEIFFKVDFKMCIKVIVAALAVATVDARPQFGNFFQPVFQRQRNLVAVNVDGSVNGGRTFVPSFGRIQQQPDVVNTVYLNPEPQVVRLPQSVNNRHAEVLPTNVVPIQNNIQQGAQNRNAQMAQMYIDPNQIQNTGQLLQTNVVNTNHQVPMQSNFQGNQIVKTNRPPNQQNVQRLQAPERQNPARQQVVKTNRDSEQQNVQNLSHNQGHIPTATNIIDNKQTKLFTNVNIPVLEQTGVPNDNDNREKNGTNRIRPMSKQPDTTDLRNRPSDKPDQNRKTVSANENDYNGRSNNSSADGGPVFANSNPPVLKPSNDRAEERTGADGMKEEDDRWVWGYDETTPSVDDRASFDASACPQGQVKVGDMCVDKD